jgi:hypothetical protein
VDLERLRAGFLACAARLEGEYPAAAALAAGLGRGPSPAAQDLFNRFYRILSVTEPNIPLLLGGLHALALQGQAPELARFFPSCGGSFAPGDGESLAEAAEAVMDRHREELLDFMLSREVEIHAVERSAAFLLGALATAERFGGGLSVVELGCCGGLNLTFDRYRYRFGVDAIGDSPLELPVEIRGDGAAVRRLLSKGMPAVRGRIGLDANPKDLTDPAEEIGLAAFFWPDQAEQVARFRKAAELQRQEGRPPIRYGTAEEELLPLLTEAYEAMPPGNTLYICQSLLWPHLSDDQRQRTTLAVQRLAARLQPQKPLAWLQMEPFAPGGMVELRLLTFGWADPEDREVRRLAEADPLLRWVDWQG